MKRLSLWLLFFAAISLYGYSQSNIIFEIKTLSIRPMPNPNSTVLATNLDAAGRFTFEPGLIISYEKGLKSEMFYAKFSQGGFIDGAGKAGGFTHIGFRFRAAKKMGYKGKTRNAFHIGAGPAFYYRQSWAANPLYVNEPAVYTSGNLQYFMYVVAEVEYLKTLSKKSDLSISADFGYPAAFQLSVGYKYWFNRRYNDCGC